MSVIMVIGAQWGDEAKGKIVDLLSQDARLTARFNGGDNAGHTVINPHGTFKLRLTPTGFSNPETICAIGPGVVVNLATLISEIQMIRDAGIDLRERLWVSPRCHVVMPYHPIVEGIYELAKGDASTGTTKRGMGPVYADKVSYNGIRLVDLQDKEVFREKLQIQLQVKNALFRAFKLEPLDLQTVLEEKLEQYAHVHSMVRESFGLVQNLLSNDGNIVLEGAQGSLLDNTWGTYPFCTASTTISGGVTAGLGIAPKWIKRVIGVAKAYTTRVGRGPMPTELNDEIGQTLQREGQEFGTVTGRPRRCGWFDADLVAFTARLNGLSEIALTKLDVLDTLPKIKIGVGYHPLSQMGELTHYWEGDTRWLESHEPEYIDMDGWLESTKDIRQFEKLPLQAQAYVHRIEELVKTPVSIVSVGPERNATIMR
ncbi:MAG: adenylosuccinate synthase [Chloroflexi bacterium RBG_13_48_10]|nr:MAG: adenylosuccinate synthase [Chloroflexi bacterium RBG_13_48_10]